MARRSTETECHDAPLRPSHQVAAVASVRETWGSKFHFIFSCLGYAVGLGNVWRFPYLCYKNGGGAFLVPYVITIFFTGVPMYLLECSLGQWVGSSGLRVWKLVPILKGIGFAALINCCWVSVFYIVILAWVLFYFFASLTNEVPWGSCGNWWNTETCVSAYARLNLSTVVSPLNNATLYDINGTFYESTSLTDPVKEYWERRVLMISDGLASVGGLRWELVGTLGLVWFMVYFCIWRGVTATGKVLYFIVGFPYCLLAVLLVRGVTLPGAMDGIRFYLTPNLSKLAEPQVWMDAVTQICFSYGLGINCLVSLSSYSEYGNQFYKQTFVMCAINSCTSFVSGFAIFSVLGFMAHEQHKDIADVAASGPGLVFLAYPSAILQLPLSPLWACLFFMMFLNLGLGSQIQHINTLASCLIDQYPKKLKNKTALVTGAICVAAYLVGFSCITQGGIYVFHMMNILAASDAVLLWIVFFECIAIGWVFGVDPFFDGIEDMLGFRPGRWLKVCWTVITPLICTAIFILYFSTISTFTYLNYTYPWWGNLIGVAMGLSSTMCIPAMALHHVLKQKGTLVQKWRRACRRPITTVEEVRRFRQENLQMGGSARSTTADL